MCRDEPSGAILAAGATAGQAWGESLLTSKCTYNKRLTKKVAANNTGYSRLQRPHMRPPCDALIPSAFELQQICSDYRFPKQQDEALSPLERGPTLADDNCHDFVAGWLSVPWQLSVHYGGHACCRDQRAISARFATCNSRADLSRCQCAEHCC